QQDAWTMDASLRSEYHRQLVGEAQKTMFVSEADIAEEMPEAVRGQARRLAQAVEKAAMKVDGINYMREMVNYDYWLQRCEMEQLEIAINARKTVKLADELFLQARLEEARKQYENAWVHWKQIFEKYPTMISRDTGQNLEPSIANYMELLGQFDEQLPDDFELKELVATLEFAPRTLPESNIQFPSPAQPNRIKGQVPSQDYLKNK
ncbi:MAG: hypothetical protein VX738_13910, partial [Planctomycetota bacterium]|nr:hypothetical protein [Planctomycetota bacterium]